MALATKQQIEDYQRHSLGWQATNLKIINKRSELVPFVHNVAQIKVYQAMRLQIDAGLPIMLIILKARQEGISTFIEGCIFERINTRKNRHGCIASMDQVSTEKVFRMCQTFQEEMPDDMRRKTVRASAKEIRYSAPWRSSMLCQTAGKRTLGRGGTTQYVHATEVAFWANAETQLVGLLQEVPDEPDTMIIQESTANGVGGSFYKTYWAAVKRLRANREDYRGYIPVFLSWQDFPEYRTPLPKGCKTVPNMTPETEDYVKEGLEMGISLDPEQIYFAMLICQNKCGGDWSRFKAEYPRTAREAFQSTGRMVFNINKLDAMEKNCKPPKAYIEFWDDNGKVKIRNVNRRENCWAIWKHPESNHHYICFGDVAEGVLSDPSEAKSALDRSVAAILDRNRFDVPCTYYGRPDTIDFGDQMVLASKFYNFAYASPEMNSIGQSVLDCFKRNEYPNIYYRERKEETDAREDSPLLGWKTTIKTRKPMIADLKKVVDEGELLIYDIRFIDEMRVFIWNEHGKPEHEKGENDDCVITLAGCIQLHQRSPFAEDYSWLDDGPKKVPEIAVMGGYDTEDEDVDPLDAIYEDEPDVDLT